jgi:hypothetical protein
LLQTLQNSASLVQSKLKNINSSVLQNAVIVLDDFIEKAKLRNESLSYKTKRITQYTFLRDIIKKELRDRLIGL